MSSLELDELTADDIMLNDDIITITVKNNARSFVDFFKVITPYMI